MPSSFCVLDEHAFRSLCLSFFTGPYCAKRLDMSLQEQTPETILAWMKPIAVAYEEHVGSYIRGWVAHVRQGWDWKRSEGPDPLNGVEHTTMREMYKTIRYGLFEEKVSLLPRYVELYSEHLALVKIREAEARLHVTVDGIDFRAEAVADVLWAGWECDALVWIVDDAGERKVVTSDHGNLQFVDADFLKERIRAYETALQETKALLAMVEPVPYVSLGL